MNPGDGLLLGMGAIVVVAGLSAVDLHRVEASAITVYTTPALREVLERGVLPAWEARGEDRVELVYVAAGQQYNRLRMSGSRPEADLFLHASPLFLEKGYDQGHFLPVPATVGERVAPGFRGGDDGSEDPWVAFAWSPIVEVYAPALGQAPDLARDDVRIGFPHPTLSNNGVYAAMFVDQVAPDAGPHIRAHTVVQPVNARTNILGVADGSFDATLGYEVVARFFEEQGAGIAIGWPRLEGREVSTPALFAAGLVDGPRPEAARRFLEHLFSEPTQALLAQYHVRPALGSEGPALEGGPPLVHVDWNEWEAIEATLPRYEAGYRG